MKLHQVEGKNQQLDLSIQHSDVNGSFENPNGPHRPLDTLFKSYFEGKLLQITGHLSDQQTLWFKPNLVAPQGFTLWAAGQVRKISIVTKAEFLQ